MLVLVTAIVVSVWEEEVSDPGEVAFVSEAALEGGTSRPFFFIRPFAASFASRRLGGRVAVADGAAG